MALLMVLVVVVLLVAVGLAVAGRRFDTELGRVHMSLGEAERARTEQAEAAEKATLALAVECRRLQSEVAVAGEPSLGIVGDLVKATVVVTLKSGTAFRGALYEADDRAVVLKNAEKSEPGKLVPVDGEVVVLRDDIDFIQRP